MAERAAVDRHAKPEIINSEQGGQFTCNAFLDPLRQEEVQISIDGRWRWMDNVSIKRLWRTIKHEDVYLHCYENPRQLRQGIDRFFHCYNEQSPHQGPGYRTPGEVHQGEETWNPKAGRSPFHPAAPTNCLKSTAASLLPWAASVPSGRSHSRRVPARRRPWRASGDKKHPTSISCSVGP